ncbi:MAG: dienelactone hydrolase family protein [Candidatus Eiseniibacteriota bacterium]
MMDSGTRERRFKVEVDDGRAVSAIAQGPAGGAAGGGTACLLAHGAGSDMHSPFLRHVCRFLARETPTVRFNFLYKELGRRAPDPTARLEATYRAVVAALASRRELRPRRLVAGGKSMGGRIATHLAAAGESFAGLVLLGYPLHPAGHPERLRDAHLPRVDCPMLFVQGTRDRLCDLDRLGRVLPRLAAPHTLHVIEGADHSFRVPRRSGRTEKEVLDEIGAVVAGWIASVVRTSPAGAGNPRSVPRRTSP